MATVTVIGQGSKVVGRVTGRVHVAAGAAARGDVSGGALVLDEGAEFDGRIDNDFTLPPELGGGSAERPRRRS